MVVLCKVSKVIRVILLSFIIGLAAGFLLSQGEETGLHRQALVNCPLPSVSDVLTRHL